MTAGILLAVYVAAVGFLGPATLGRRWAICAPRLAISLWLALSLSWIVAVILAVLALTMSFSLSWPASAPGNGPAMLAAQTAPRTTAVAAAGLLLAAAVILRTCGCLASGLRRAGRERREHASFVAAVGRPNHELRAAIIDDDRPLAYCLPRGSQQVVVSTATLAVLGPGQLQSVLAHERAHLRGRHHLMLTAAFALARAFPQVPLLAQAGPQITVLAEMAADDAAVRGHDPGSLAAALVVLARAGARTTALTAGGVAAAARLERLLAPPARLGRPTRSVRLAGAVAALALPAVIACLPLMAAACDVITQP
jgi:Zn-dependent protease with chaperone function